MNPVSFISGAVVPLLFLGILLYGAVKKIRLFETFAQGAGEGMRTAVSLLPTFIGLFLAVSCMRASGLLGALTNLLAPLSSLLRFPSALLPIALTKFISSSAATGLILDLFETFGPDSLEGRMTAIMIGSTETILYTMSVYFASVGIRKTRWTLAGAILSTLAGIAASCVIANAM